MNQSQILSRKSLLSGLLMLTLFAVLALETKATSSTPGVHLGDVVVRIEGDPVRSSGSLFRASLPLVGDTVNLTVLQPDNQLVELNNFSLIPLEGDVIRLEGGRSSQSLGYPRVLALAGPEYTQGLALNAAGQVVGFVNFRSSTPDPQPEEAVAQLADRVFILVDGQLVPAKTVSLESSQGPVTLVLPAD